VDALTIHEAAQTTGWSPRMLRYIERVGLLDAARSEGGYRLGFAQRLRTDSELRASVDAWFQAEAQRPEDVPASDWLRFEQDKHERLLAAAAALT
jgi:MerR family copper efflux transcriptional regulator